MADTQTAVAPATTTEQVLEKGLLDQIVEEGRLRNSWRRSWMGP